MTRRLTHAVDVLDAVAHLPGIERELEDRARHLVWHVRDLEDRKRRIEHRLAVMHQAAAQTWAQLAASGQWTDDELLAALPETAVLGEWSVA